MTYQTFHELERESYRALVSTLLADGFTRHRCPAGDTFRKGARVVQPRCLICTSEWFAVLIH